MRCGCFVPLRPELFDMVGNWFASFLIVGIALQGETDLAMAAATSSTDPPHGRSDYSCASRYSCSVDFDAQPLPTFGGFHFFFRRALLPAFAQNALWSALCVSDAHRGIERTVEQHLVNLSQSSCAPHAACPKILCSGVPGRKKSNGVG